MEKYKDRTLCARKRAEDLLGRLTLTEKVGQLNQRLYGFTVCKRDGDRLSLSEEFCREVERFGGLGVLYGLYRADPWSGRDYENGLVGEFAIQAYNMVQEYVISHSRFGIPALMSSESPHGHQALDGYLLPVNLAVGATWNPALAERGARVCAKEMRTLGVDLALVSMLDVLRDPRWGRCEECFGEDPYLASQFARAVVCGYREEGVDVVAKHFAAQGETTGGINASAARIGERELREIHLPPAQAAVEAGAAGVMAAYNEIDGIPCHNNRWLLDEVLRGEMGFDGIVMADGVAVDRLGFLYGTVQECGAAALSSGVDVSLWDEGFAHLEEAFAQGLVTQERLDEAVLRVLTRKFERGLFEQPYLTHEKFRGGCAKERAKEDADSGCPAACDTVSLALAQESMILLKNEDAILPLAQTSPQKKRKVALIGEHIRDIYALLGDYTPPVRSGSAWTIERGFRHVFAQQEGMELVVCDTVQQAKGCDVTVLVLGGSSSRFGEVEFDVNGAAIAGQKTKMDCGEGVDLSSLELPAEQLALANSVFASCGRVVTAVIAGRPYAISEIARCTDALLYCFYPGPAGGLALARAVCGLCEPSGRLPVSLPGSASQLPVWYNHRISYEAMHYADESAGAVYPFGFGLGYGQAQYEAFDFQMESGAGTVSFWISNPCGREISAVPMLFISHLGGSIVPRKEELKRFGKYRLAPGQARRVCFAIEEDDLAVWDCRMQRRVEPGMAVLAVRDGARSLWQAEITKELCVRR